MSEDIDYENVTYEQAEELSIQSKKHWTVILCELAADPTENRLLTSL